jgi:rare lipoprotein A
MRRRLASHASWLLTGTALGIGCLALTNCTASNKLTSKVDPKYGVSASPRVIEPGQPVPKGGGAYRVGKPYYVAGKMYVPEENRRYRGEGTASWYGDDFHGRLTANGEIYDMESISAAHPTMPMPSYARVTNLRNGRSLIVRVNDRGPYHDDRVIDLSAKAADLLQFRGKGTARVRVEYVGPAALEGSDDRKLMATLREDSPAPAPSSVMVASAKPFVPQPPPSVRPDSSPRYELRRGDDFASQAGAALRRHDTQLETSASRSDGPFGPRRPLLAEPAVATREPGRAPRTGSAPPRPEAGGTLANARGLY